MRRWLFAVVLLPLPSWSIALAGSLGADGPARGATSWRGDAAAVATIATHLGVAAWLRLTRRRPRPGPDPEWADVQAERHRRLGTTFAAWGLLAASAWSLVRPGAGPGSPVGGAVVLVLAGNLGFQAVVLGASGLAVAARVRLGRAVVGEPATGA